jgi:hypothetical protein
MINRTLHKWYGVWQVDIFHYIQYKELNNK